ncbi:hypothetical protein Tco_0418295 [Tanacetum coccineum]
MNPQETQQVATRDEKWVPFTKRVKIRSTNVRLETTVPQKEETFQVVTDLIKNSSCFKAFTISEDVLEIFMQQFWYSIKKVQGTDSYEFILANKECVVNTDVFRMILDISQEWKVENVDYPELIWEDLAFPIDHKKEKRSRREDYQEYGLAILEVMLNDAIKQSESYQMFIKYSTGQIPPNKSRGKGSQRKKIADDSQETVDVSEESEPKPELVKRKTASRRVVKKKVTIFADDNIISDDPDVALELGKSISKTKAEEAEAARQVHATHARIGVPSLTPKEQEAADTMQALKEIKKTSKRQPGTRGSSEGTSNIPGVPNESTVVYATSSEGTGTKPGVPDEEKDITEENVILEWGLEQESEYSEEDKLDDEEKDDKEGDADGEGDDHISDIQDTDNEDCDTPRISIMAASAIAISSDSSDDISPETSIIAPVISSVAPVVETTLVASPTGLCGAGTKAANIDQSPPREMRLKEIEDLKQHYLDEMKSLSNDLQIKDYRNEKIDIRFRRECEDMIAELKSKFNGMSIEINKKEELQYLEQVANLSTSQRFKSFCYDDDDDEYTIHYREYLENSSNAIAPVLPIEEPDNSLSMGDEHLSTIPETESDEVTKSSVEDLVPIPSESEGISNDTCDVPFCDNSPPLDALNDHFEIFSDFNDDCTLSDDDSFEDIDYVEASPPDSELVSLEEVKDDILHEKLLNINLLIACDLPSSDDFSPIFEEKSVTFSNPLFDSNDDFTSSDNESLSH